MNETPVDKAISDLTTAVKVQGEELQRHKQNADSSWKYQSQASSLASELSRAKDTIEKQSRELAQLRGDNYYWKQAVRFEQCLKKRQGRIRHVPNFNSVHRAKLTVAEWTNCERIFLRHWRDENKRKAGINGGCGLLELLLSENSNAHAADLTQRDATVAACVVQWLGTNCGQSFLIECEREIKTDRDKKRKGRAA